MHYEVPRLIIPEQSRVFILNARPIKPSDTAFC